MRLTNIYTKTGDGGQTRLASGEKISKSNQRIRSYGTVDELNAVVGMLSDTLKIHTKSLYEENYKFLKTVQNLLFDVGGELSFADEKVPDYVQTLNNDHIQLLEKQIDAMNSELKPLKNFILPGGHLAQSTAHLARVVCRRAEREVVELSEKEDVRPELVKFLNRLSDWFFVFCRYINLKTDTPENTWEQTKS